MSDHLHKGVFRSIEEVDALIDRIDELEAKFTRMENAWRRERDRIEQNYLESQSIVARLNAVLDSREVFINMIINYEDYFEHLDDAKRHFIEYACNRGDSDE
jgi:hypothetical protein